MTPRLAVLVSAGGTTLQNLLDRSADGRLDARVALVISSNPGVYALERAAAAGVPSEVVARKSFTSAEAFSGRVFELCREAGVDLVCLAGFLQLLRVPADFRGRVLNVHPSLIPAFCGKGYYGHHVHEAALARGVKVSGCTVHLVDDEYDHGPILVQKAVEVRDDDTADTLAARVFAAECEAYPEAITLVASGRGAVKGG